MLLISPLFLSGIIKQKSKQKFAKAIGTVTNVNDDLKGSNVSAYKVKFTYTGYVSFLGKCPEAGQNGTVVLTGQLTGTETSSDDDILYRGILQLEINIDICSTKRQANGEDVRCIITVGGSGLVKTELEIQSDQRGGYIQIKDTTPSGFKKNVTGSCDPQEMIEEHAMVPIKSIASVFNGMELPMLTQKTLRAQKYPQKYPPVRVDGGEIVVEVLQEVKL
ncbi:MAG: hypothetical protein EPN92_06015 [Chitinophagaceae bacterium]|nr:MAG: hypothetical protein EPN92_06015 [Chitinophagaceae bacterium]